MKRTRKWSFVAQEAVRLAGLGLGSREIGARLSVTQSTVNKWMAAGKLPRVAGVKTPRKRRRTITAAVALKGQSPEQWANGVRREYALDGTDEQLVSLGADALRISKDPLVSPAVRLSASGRFASLAKQLALVARQGEKEQPEAPPAAAPRQMRVVRRSSDTTDPRIAMMNSLAK